MNHGCDIGQTAAFVANVDGRSVDLTPLATPGRCMDVATGSVFDLRGRHIDGVYRGAERESVLHVDPFWFSWVAFQPTTGIVQP